jgi:hypothetical protein
MSEEIASFVIDVDYDAPGDIPGLHLALNVVCRPTVWRDTGLALARIGDQPRCPAGAQLHVGKLDFAPDPAR